MQSLFFNSGTDQTVMNENFFFFGMVPPGLIEWK